MFERFTAKARRTIVLAQEEARTLDHNYIGTEHILLGLLHEGDGAGPLVLAQIGMTLEDARAKVVAIVGTGKQPVKGGHIPFTPRAKKVLELSLREALTLHHNYIGTEHIVLGLLREGDGVAAQVMRQYADLLRIRALVLDSVEAGTPGLERRRVVWARRLASAVTETLGIGKGEGDDPEEDAATVSATPAADETIATAARLAGSEPVGSHHLLLAALTDANSAAARVLASLGVDLTQAKDALHHADVAGTSDELPEEAGRRQMNLKVTDELLTIVVADPNLVRSANAAVRALGEKATPGATIRGADLTGIPARNLAQAWTALQAALSAIVTGAHATAGAEARKAAEAQVEAAQEAGPADSGTDADTATGD
jgi:ATP-dependent Clp protease ATP-binding subunit ClpC